VDGVARFEFTQQGSHLTWKMVRKGWLSGIQTTQEAVGSVTMISDTAIELEGRYQSSNQGNVVGQSVRLSLTRDGNGLRGYELASSGTRVSVFLKKQ
jgi:hypothetical protein